MNRSISLSLSLSAVSRRNNDWKGGKTTRETEEIMGIECGKKGMERKKKKGGTKDVIAVSIEKIQDIFARPISMIFFFFFFFFEDWKIFRNGRALVASGIKSYDPFIEAFVIPWYIRRNSSSPGSLCEKWMSNLQLGLLFENVILDKNEKSIYKERERDRDVLEYSLYTKVYLNLWSQCKEYYIFFGFGFRLCPW